MKKSNTCTTIEIMCTFIVLIQLEVAECSKKWKGCKVPALQSVADFAWDQSGEEANGYYFPMSSTSDVSIENEMLGSDGAKCIRMKWSDDSITVNIFYRPGTLKDAYFKCKQIRPPKNIWECEHLHPKGETPDLSHTAWITLTDNKTFSFTIRCFHNLQQQGWVVFSTSPKLSHELRDKLLHHAKSFDYSVLIGEDVFVRNYDENSCPSVCLK